MAAFVSDNWRVRDNLSLEGGVRYELASPHYSQMNNLVNFDPALYDAAKAVQLNRTSGAVLAGSGNPYIGLVRAGSGVPEDELFRVTLDEKAAALIPASAPRGLYPTYHLFMPRFSAAFTLNQKTALRGGVGLYYDKPEGNVIFSQTNLPPFVPSVSVENGNLANPLAGRAAAEAVLGTVNAIDPNLKTPRQLNFSVSVQRELRGGHLAEIAYVGNRGRNQLWFPEINQPSFDVLVANQALPTAERAHMNYLRPYRGYSSIRQRRSDAFSDYDALQLYLNRRRGVVSYTIAYTLSKATGNASGIGDNPTAVDDAFDLAFHTGPLSFDRRHVLLTTWTYRVPFMRDRRDFFGQVLGGWELSGKTRWQSGQYLTPDGATGGPFGNRRADYLGGEISIDDRGAARWFNTDAFARAPDGRRGTATVGMIEGPHRSTWDVSLRKNFHVIGRSQMQFRADAFNVFNKVNLNNPNVRTTDAAYGSINSARPPRQIQLSLRITY